MFFVCSNYSCFEVPYMYRYIPACSYLKSGLKSLSCKLKLKVFFVLLYRKAFIRCIDFRYCIQYLIRVFSVCSDAVNTYNYTLTSYLQKLYIYVQVYYPCVKLENEIYEIVGYTYELIFFSRYKRVVICIMSVFLLVFLSLYVIFNK